jgi:hypothetical protein
MRRTLGRALGGSTPDMRLSYFSVTLGRSKGSQRFANVIQAQAYEVLALMIILCVFGQSRHSGDRLPSGLTLLLNQFHACIARNILHCGW